MAPRSVTIQLAPGVGYATLPDHRKMTSGVQYEIDWDTFSKISPQARQSFITVVQVNGDVNTTTGQLPRPDQTSNAVPQLGIWSLLTTPSTAAAGPTINSGGLNLSGKGFQGWTAIQTPSSFLGSTNFVSVTVTGPQDEKFTYVNNSGGAISAGDVVVWSSPTLGASARQVTPTHVANNLTNVNSGYNVFAGVALTNGIPAGGYGWIQIEGECPVVNVNASVAAGDPIYPDPATNARAITSTGVFTVVTDVTTGVPVTKPVVPFGTALTAASSNKSAVHIRSFRSKVPYKRVYNKN